MDEIKSTAVRLRVSELAELRALLRLPPETTQSDVLRAAVAQVLDVPISQLKRPRGRPRKTEAPAA